MPSSDYIAQVVAIDDSVADGQLRGIRKYGSCYDARTDALAATLARSRRGPTKAAAAEFASLESAIKDFSANAIATAPHASPGYPKEAFANLYEKKFRREFYDEYEAKLTKTTKPTTAEAKSSPARSDPKSPTTSAPNTSPSSTAPANTAPHEATAEERAKSDADPVTQAKNKFGKILEALPDDQMHQIHSAFSEVIGAHEMSEGMRLAVYRYAIFLLQPEGATTPEQTPF
jgi:hypothetical protein